MYVYIHLPVPFCIRILFLQQFIIHGHVEYQQLPHNKTYCDFKKYKDFHIHVQVQQLK